MRRAGTAIEAFLSVAGATETVLALEERALVAGLRADANRLANADHANLVRQSRSARAQLEAARTLLESGTLEQLAPTLQSAAELRLRHPSLSLREFASTGRPSRDEGRDGRAVRAGGRVADEEANGIGPD